MAAGLSIRAIAAATGLGKSTIDRELAPVPNGTGEPITGTDGKTYTPKPRKVDQVADADNPAGQPVGAFVRPSA